jgi:hypothetical protein
LSSVISAKSTSSFSLSGAEENYRHKSKYNQLGARQKKKKKTKKKGRTKVQPGSQEELLGLVQTILASCIDDKYLGTIGETIEFLSRNGNLVLARRVYGSYVSFCELVSKSREERMESARQDRLAQDARERREGTDGKPPTTLNVEKQVDELVCASLPETLTELFSLLPAASTTS